MNEPKDEKRPPAPAATPDDKPDPAYTGMPAKEGGGKVTEADRHADSEG